VRGAVKGLFRRPLARWGFTVCAAVALLTGQPEPFLVCAVLAAHAWRCKR
jgi:hypothetical protein